MMIMELTDFILVLEAGLLITLLQALSDLKEKRRNEAQGGEIMPRQDGTGPDGDGPKTGRKKGPCK